MRLATDAISWLQTIISTHLAMIDVSATGIKLFISFAPCLLGTSMNDTLVPIYYFFGFRKVQVNHCRLRLAISNLKYDLFRHHLLDDPVCSCGYTAETSEQFLLNCPIYNIIRNKTINKIEGNERNINTLLFGNDQLHLHQFFIYFFGCYSPRFFVPNWPLVNL